MCIGSMGFAGGAWHAGGSVGGTSACCWAAAVLLCAQLVWVLLCFGAGGGALDLCKVILWP